MPPVNQLNSLKTPTEFATSPGHGRRGSAILPASVTKVFVPFLGYKHNHSQQSGGISIADAILRTDIRIGRASCAAHLFNQAATFKPDRDPFLPLAPVQLHAKQCVFCDAATLAISVLLSLATGPFLSMRYLPHTGNKPLHVFTHTVRPRGVLKIKATGHRRALAVGCGTKRTNPSNAALVPSQAARHAGKEKIKAWALRAKEAVISSKVVNLMIGFVGLGAQLAIASTKLTQHLHYVHCKGSRILRAAEIFSITSGNRHKHRLYRTIF
ncbi:hypothetical protein B0J12DRAFT_682040 [Macrophomina phaseolina]|uniref:Uncharacterized protein n=1 Tax=Macrophomina phaseolina TaxID=35725 RepID=A0ABQ8FWQ2_9PEZI|nr:hypothetical protein B0J12DRAFT_682040 [Macrophomina phaseolina]